jgi:hypothetical protein
VRNFRFAGSNDLTGNRASDVQFELIESHIFPLQSQAWPVDIAVHPDARAPNFQTAVADEGHDLLFVFKDVAAIWAAT